MVEKIELQIDAGAIDTVAPKAVGGHLPIMETEAVRRKVGYVAATGTKLANYGEDTEGHHQGRCSSVHGCAGR